MINKKLFTLINAEKRAPMYIIKSIIKKYTHVKYKIDIHLHRLHSIRTTLNFILYLRIKCSIILFHVKMAIKAP